MIYLGSGVDVIYEGVSNELRELPILARSLITAADVTETPEKRGGVQRVPFIAVDADVAQHCKHDHVGFLSVRVITVDQHGVFTDYLAACESAIDKMKLLWILENDCGKCNCLFTRPKSF